MTIMKKRLLRKIFQILFTILCNLNITAQVDTLIGGVENKLIKISQNNGSHVNYMTINNFPAGKFINKLTWCAENNCFYTLANQLGTLDNKLSIISANGNYILKGTVTFAGGTVYHLENISFDPITKNLYAAASLNGSISNSDYHSESLIKIDTTTLQATLVGVALHQGTVKEAEFDNIDIGSDGFLYYTETQTSSNVFFNIYKQNLNFSSLPTLIYSEPANISVGDITERNNIIYFVSDRKLRKIDLSNNSHSYIGNIFTPNNFNGNQMYALDWIPGDNSNTGNGNGNNIGNSNNIGDIIIPNIFTPNSDGINDLFSPINISNNKFEIYILNRWGNLMTILNETNKSWDGKDASEGTYFYILKIKNTEIIKHGFFQLER